MITLMLLSLALAPTSCKGFRVAQQDGGSVAGDATAPTDGQKRRDQQRGEASLADLSQRNDWTVGPIQPCRPQPLACLDPTSLDVLEVPDEMSAEQAFTDAVSGNTIQIKSLSLGSGWKVPSLVTLRGCQGATLAGGIVFAGSGGTIEGFEISGSVVANKTGVYSIRQNRFVGEGNPTEPGVSARSVDALVSASVAAIVEGNWFASRAVGVEARTKYDTMNHSVTIIIRNNIFSGVEQGISLAETGLVGHIEATIEQNTFYDFERAIVIQGVDSGSVKIAGALFAAGDKAVDANTAYEAVHSLVWQVKNPHPLPPLSGALASGDPAFVDGPAGDFRLQATSAALDTIPAVTVVPEADYFGCPRPIAILTDEARADIGAIEVQKE